MGFNISSLIGGLFGGDDAKKAAELQAQGALEAENKSQPYYQGAINYLQPYMQAGTGANNILAQILNGTPEEQSAIYGRFKSSPLYQSFFEALPEQFRQGAGEMAAGGLYRSGANIEARNRIASQGMQGALTNWLGLAQNQGAQGLNAAGTSGQFSMQRGQDIMGLTGNRYNALANAQMAKSAIGNDFLGKLIGGVGTGVGYGFGTGFGSSSGGAGMGYGKG